MWDMRYYGQNSIILLEFLLFLNVCTANLCGLFICLLTTPTGNNARDNICLGYLPSYITNVNLRKNVLLGVSIVFLGEQFLGVIVLCSFFNVYC